MNCIRANMLFLAVVVLILVLPSISIVFMILDGVCQQYVLMHAFMLFCQQSVLMHAFLLSLTIFYDVSDFLPPPSLFAFRCILWILTLWCLLALSLTQSHNHATVIDAFTLGILLPYFLLNLLYMCFLVYFC